MRKRLTEFSARLANRFVFAAVTVNLILVSLFYLVIVNVMVSNIQDEFIATARVKSDLIARLLPRKQDAEEIASALQDIMLAGEVVYADYGAAAPLLAATLPGRGTPVFQEDFQFGEHGDDIYFISVPLENHAAGRRLRLGFSELPVRQYIMQTYRNGLYLSALYLALLVPLSILAARSLSGPIEALRQRAHAIANGNVDVPMEQHSGIHELQLLGSDLERMRATLVAREARHAAVLDNAAEGILTLDRNGCILSANRSAQDLFSCAPGRHQGLPLALALGASPATFLDSNGRFHLENRKIVNIPPDRDRKRGSRELSITASVFLQEGEPVHVLLVQDITQHKALQDRLQFLAYHDVLTGLPNRQQFAETLQSALDAAQRSGRKLAVLYLDLDHFKVINDSLGHQYGDLLLQQAAERLLACVRESDIVARMGGDEFTVLLGDIEQRDDAGRVADKIIEALSAPFDLRHYEHYVGASIGIVFYPEDGKQADELVKQADTAMYQAKTSGRNRYSHYNSDMQRSAVRRLSLANNLRHALKHDQLRLHYQPILSVREKRLVGAEALARWHHPEHGDIPPGEFIPVAEESGIITDLGIWAMEQAASDARQLLEAVPVMRISVNISAHQLYHRNFYDTLERIARDNPQLARHMVLEITETAAMVDVEGASRRLARARDLGFFIALDDFGTGHSSLSYLRRLPVDVLKIDRSFIHDLSSPGQDAGIVSNILKLASSLALKTVAEGVETVDQLDMLREHGCYAAQGFLFSRALERKAFIAAIEDFGKITTPASEHEPSPAAQQNS